MQISGGKYRTDLPTAYPCQQSTMSSGRQHHGKGGAFTERASYLQPSLMQFDDCPDGR